MAKFQESVGMIIHHCGALEFFINNAIKFLAKDELLAREVAKQRLGSRIRLLITLLEERKQMSKSEGKALQQKLSTVARHRNEVAHNPIFVKKNKTSRELCILIVDRKNDPPKHREIKQAELESLVREGDDLLREFKKLLPECSKI
jgi:hypothetical protein